MLNVNKIYRKLDEIVDDLNKKPREYWDKAPYTYTQECSWRKGLAIFSISKSSGRDWMRYYLADDNGYALYEIIGFSEGGCIFNYRPIQRALGGFYIIIKDRTSIYTYPGKDKDTDYTYYYSVKEVISEDGVLLDKNSYESFVINHPVLFLTEDLGEGFVVRTKELFWSGEKIGTYEDRDTISDFCFNKRPPYKNPCVYKLENYSYVPPYKKYFDTKEDITIISGFENGVCNFRFNNKERITYYFVVKDSKKILSFRDLWRYKDWRTNNEVDVIDHPKLESYHSLSKISNLYNPHMIANRMLYYYEKILYNQMEYDVYWAEYEDGGYMDKDGFLNVDFESYRV